MRCMNCGLPLSPSRTLTNCPRCGAALNAFQGAQQPQQQFEQTGWESGMGGAGQQNLWGQGGSSAPDAFSPFPQQSQGNPNAFRASGLQQTPMAPRRPYETPQSKANPRLLFMIAGVCVFLAAMILGLVFVLAQANGGNPSPNTASNQNSTATATATGPASATATSSSSTPDPNATATGTPYPGQQYIDNAQMAQGVDAKTLAPKNPTTTFTVGSKMYVVFKLHPPSQGGAYCAYWYQNGKQISQPYAYPVKGTSRGSFVYFTYGQAGDGYVELFWASSVSCSDQQLAQHVDFTVTA
ncbi:MAG TPA: hypothetical protein VF458_09800 [Ktedonobacteraceae bacterium]